MAALDHRIFRELGKGGRMVVALYKTFWADRFGMLVDRFGTPWLINCGGSDEPAGKAEAQWPHD
jgi:PhnB protein